MGCLAAYLEAMRILHLTDTHLGVRQQVRGAPAGWSRADDHMAAFDAALRPALRGEVDLVVHSGDLFDRSRPPPRAVALAAERLLSVVTRVPVVLMAGNHDRRGLKRWLPHPDPNLHVIDRPTRVVVGSVALAVVPFVRDADAWAAAAQIATGGGADLLVAHQAVHGARVPGFTFGVGAQRDTLGAHHLPPGTRWVMCGHLHPRQVTALGEAWVVQPGSTERTHFSERGQVKGAAVWTLGRQIRHHFLDLPSRPMVRVSRSSHLPRVQPGTLVRADNPALEDRAMARGGWLWGQPTDLQRSGPQPRPRRSTSRQLALWS